MHLYEDYIKTTKEETEPNVEKVQAQPINAVTSQDLEDMKKALTEMIQETNKTTRQELLDFLRHEQISNTEDEKQDDVEDKETVDEIIRPEENQANEAIGNTINNK